MAGWSTDYNSVRRNGSAGQLSIAGKHREEFVRDGQQQQDADDQVTGGGHGEISLEKKKIMVLFLMVL